MTTLNYLNFDASDDTEGVSTLEAMASTWPEQAPAVRREIALVLDWACRTFPGQRGPVGEGGDWDYDLHGQQEFTAPETLTYDEATRQLAVRAGPPGKPRHTVTLSISGTDAFCAAFRAEFGGE